jgi:hypothetical protein
MPPAPVTKRDKDINKVKGLGINTSVGGAAMARWDMRLVDTAADDVAFLHDFHVATPRLDSEGVRVQVVGQAS